MHMTGRRRLAVMMGGIVNKGYQHELLHGIIDQAYALNYDVLIFSSFANFDTEVPHQYGEDRIYDLFDIAKFDAVIYAPCSVYSDKVRGIMESHLAEQSAPVVVVEPISTDEITAPRIHNVFMDDFHAFGRVVDHLIEVHHVKKIYCLTGFKDNIVAEERLRGYRDSMARHGLPVEEDWVIYGDFWKFKAQEVAEDIAAGRMEMPEAFVVACDTAAVTLTNRLVELGFRIPEDLLVVSYDAGTEAPFNVPSVTTYARPIRGMGIRGVLKAHEILTGQKAEPVADDKGFLIPAESCGCGKDMQQRFELHQKELQNSEDWRNIFDNTPMSEKLNSSTTLNDLLYHITEHLYLSRGIKDWYLCLCDGWDDPDKESDDPEDYNRYTPQMHLRICNQDDVTTIPDIAFPAEQIIPVLDEDRPEPRAYYLTPLHFNDRCLGYMVLSYGNTSRAYDMLYHNWTRQVANALEFIRIRNHLNSINQQLYSTSMRDPLTGIYNRQGFKQFSRQIFETAKQTGKKLLIIAADLDGLKVINDTYGHLEGDAAITVAANALNTCHSYDEICARTGGDEYLLIGTEDYREMTPKRYIAYIGEFIRRYNLSAGKPYEVGVSLGYICREVQEGDTLEDLIEEADALMYANKKLRKKERKD